MIKVDERDLYQLLISEFRYAVKRDNHLAPGTCIQHIKDYLPEMRKDWRAHTADQLTAEIIESRVWSTKDSEALAYDSAWESLLVFLTNYIEKLPYNADRYMQHLYQKHCFMANIDYFSDEIAEKIKANIAKV
jgi:hypothetical protein